MRRRLSSGEQLGMSLSLNLKPQENIWGLEARCVHELIGQRVRSGPEATALCTTSTTSVSYRQLDAWSRRLAVRLRQLGLRRGMYVPFCFEKSTAAIIAMMGILHAGGACVALDPTHPQHRRQIILEAVQTRFVLASPTHAHLFAETPLQHLIVVSPELDNDFFLDESLLEEDVGGSIAQPGDPAFVVFTSGSSGKPKGVILEHGAICTSAKYHGEAMRVDETTRVFQYAAYTFDMSIYDIFTTLIRGGCVCVPSEHERVHDIAHAMEAMRVNWAFFTPTVLSLIAPEEVPTLKTLLLAGEPVTQTIIDTWADKVVLINGYGSTEISTSFIGVLKPSSDPKYIGTTYGVDAWITDPEDTNRLLPTGSEGELVVTGPVLARGYLDNPTAMAEKFIERPAWWRPSSSSSGLVTAGQPVQVYRTGDIVRQDASGSFQFVRRKGPMVKIRGQRVELGEVEQTLSSHPDIKVCAAVFVSDGAYRDAISVAYQLHSENSSSSTGDASDDSDAKPSIRCLTESERDELGGSPRGLREFVSTRLPSYMVPSHWLAIAEMPLLSSGKVDRIRMGKWVASLSPPSSSNSAPTLDEENHDGIWNRKKQNSLVLRQIKSTVFNLSQTKFPDSLPLADAGLDSLKMMALNRFVKTTYRLSIDIPVLGSMSLSSLAQRILDHLQGVDESASTLEAPAKTRMNLLQELADLRLQLRTALPSADHGLRRVFITGATGFLGTYVLRQLLMAIPQATIICHTRARTAEQGLQRLASSAAKAGWKLEHFAHRIQVWTGDLSLPQLGLNASQWQCLTGSGPVEGTIDAVIHNAADVNWTKSYAALKAVNVLSTMSLLQAIGQSPVKPRFVYVSGGRSSNSETESAMDLLEEVETMNGYDLTKLYSHMLVKEFARLSKSNHASIVKPGYIIGTATEGIANTDDFIWRMVAGSIMGHAYNSDEDHLWLYIAGAERVAEVIVDELFQPSRPGVCAERSITDGLTVRQFWEIFQNHFHYDLRALPAAKWMQVVSSDADSKGEEHPLYPLLESLARGDAQAGAERLERSIPGVLTHVVRATIIKNAEYLQRIGFLPGPKGEKTMVARDNSLIFKRHLCHDHPIPGVVKVEM
ncbi:hypothetical protein ASPZODRAFT_130076 [Penicilliopsis zonata CBS 506.65]|uniref:Carrier domain-containing protein n=1 Tax=Penicilliopsis zonata CBS 506.65 TaxID=1073090 RepID=A0A1L9SLR6_9EURO|nr:hypothetical protein ASPZODRAFT_130076 [Penicilliopsis zonata CBS 506.65]OJJ48138.1 hypothetical protein ASPZODRAFT_130076 [Penicilliopsis zonata CBS 506.65]